MDKLRAKSDKELARIEKELKKIYTDANKELTEKWKAYMEGAEKRIAPLEKAYEDAKASGDEDLIKSTGYELGKAKKLETLNNDRYKAMVDQTAAKISDVNKIALDYVNGEMPGMYAMNYNGTIENIKTDLTEVGVGHYSFDLVDEATVRNLVMSNASLLPIKDINRAKDIAWNKKAINSQVMQGILQGESISRIASRLSNVTDMDSKVAIRNARTMCTAAENNGRMSGMKEAEEKGIVYEKQWMATHDTRTRDSHGELDGVSIPLDDEFLPNIQYPGDPAGDPAEVYNCRCSMVRKLIGFRSKDGSIVNVDGLDNYEPTYFAELQAAAAEKQSEPEKKESEYDWRKDKADFTPATTIEEAERFTKANFVDGGFNLTGKDVTFKGLDVDVANEVNATLNDIYDKFNIDKLSSVEAYGKKDKRAYSKNEDAPFFTTNMGNLGINNTVIPSVAKAEKYAEEGKKSFDYVIANMDVLSGSQLEIAKAYEKAGRSLVDDTINGMVSHEIGHHISYMQDINRELAEISRNDEWKNYAENLSGYANHTFGEYVAESFSAYYKGETDKLQPEIITLFEGLRKK